MAIPILNHMDFQKSAEIRNVRLHNTTSGGVTSPGTGQIIYDTGGSSIKFYNGSSWVEVGSGSGTVTSVTAGDGMTQTGVSTVNPTLNVVGGDGITANADEIEVAVDDSTIELSATTGSGTVRIKDLGVTTAKLANDAVTGAKLADDSVDSENYVDGSIDTAHIANDQVTYAKMQNVATANRVLGSASADGVISEIQVATAMIADDAVTSAKLAHDITIANDLTVSGNLTVSGDTITANVGTLNVEDKNITLNQAGSDTSSTADGAGLTIQDAVDASTDATLLWDQTDSAFDFSHKVTAPDLVIDNIKINGSNIGTTSDTDLMALSAGSLTVAGNIVAANFNASGNINLTGTGSITYEGSADAHEQTISFTDPTADKTITVPNATGGMVVGITKKLSGDGSTTTHTITHSFGSPIVSVTVLDYGNDGTGATYDQVLVEIQRNDDDNVDLIFASAPSASQDYLVLISKFPGIS